MLAATGCMAVVDLYISIALWIKGGVAVIYDPTVMESDWYIYIELGQDFKVFRELRIVFFSCNDLKKRVGKIKNCDYFISK